MRFTQVRNATIKIQYAGKNFLIDPMLAEKGAFPGFPGTVNSHLPNPTAPLPMPVAQITNVDATIITHTHPDHWDDAAAQLLPKDMRIFTQHKMDAEVIASAGFTNVHVMGEQTQFAGITIVKTPGQHGRGNAYDEMKEVLGEVCGLVFKHPEEKTLYVAGDTVWYDGVRQTLAKHSPDIVVLNAGDARVLIDHEAIIMGTSDVKAVCEAAPDAVIIASHMESVNHAVLTRSDLKKFLMTESIVDRVLVPDDGESYTF